jgi:hypothetical protein
MRKLIFLILLSIVFLITSTFAQGYFPLQKGNLWQYYEMPWYPIENAQILSDTILPNGNTYAVYSGIGMPSRFIRQVDAKVYGVDSQGNEFVIFDFAANDSDVISVNATFDTTRLVEKGHSSGFNQNYWIFTSGYDEMILSTWYIVDSLGIYEMMFEPGVEYTLQGARINGIVRYGTITGISQESSNLPLGITLMQNYPNPFNPSTKIDLIMTNSDEVSLRIINMLGQEIATLYQGTLDIGSHSFTWNAFNVSAGIYFCRLESSQYIVTKKLALIK